MTHRPILITGTEQVEALAQQLRGVERLAVDTEFHAERRYVPQLLLVQLALADGRTWVIDPLACDLAALAPVLARTELLLHGGHHDLGLLYRTLGTWPRAIFDTQRAAALCGQHYPMRLDALLEVQLGVTLGHGSALSDWRRRPLSPDQLRYAAEDVCLLHPLVTSLEAELQRRGRLGPAREASEELRTAALAPPRAVDAWRSWRIAPSLDDDTRRVLQAVMQWRDLQARERDQPPWFLVGDSVALELARSRPRSLEELAADRRLGSGLRKRFGGELIALVGAALSSSDAAPPAVQPETIERRALLEAWALAWQRVTGVAAGLLLPPALLTRVAEAGPGVLQGWRRTLAGPALDAFWEGRSLVGLRGGISSLATRDDSALFEPAHDKP